MKRRGLGLGKGRGYFNLTLRDPIIHSLSARGIKTYAPTVTLLPPTQFDSKFGKDYEINEIGYATTKIKPDGKVDVFVKHSGDYDRTGKLIAHELNELEIWKKLVDEGTDPDEAEEMAHNMNPVKVEGVADFYELDAKGKRTVNTKRELAEMERMNKKAKDYSKMKKSASEFMSTDLKKIKDDIKETLKEGYAHSYKIVPDTWDGGERFKVIYYEEKTPYSFYWRRGGQKSLKNSDDETAKQYLAKFRKQKIKPAFDYPVSSVEGGMYMSHLNEAIKIAKPKDAKKLLAKAKKMLAMSPYTRWSGD